jgi:ketosteroid isomerase-like protein
MKRIIFAIICTTIFAETSAQERSQNLNSMISTEYSFVAAAAELGTRDAFLKFIADDGIIFRPNPVKGKKFLEDAPKRPGLLSWYPVHAEISMAGDMGFTTGPAEFRKDKDSTAIWFGNFCTVWQKQSNGEWKFAIDIGNQNDKPIANSTPLEYQTSSSTKPQLIKGMNHKKPDELLTLDRQFKIISKKIGMVETYKKFVTDESRILRDGAFPIIGSKQISDYLSTQMSVMDFKPVGGKMSSSDDFGFTYGELEKTDPKNNLNEKFNYMHVYLKEGDRWIIAAEVLSKIN